MSWHDTSSEKLQNLAASLKRSAQDMGFLAFVILLTVLMFGTLIFALEVLGDEETFVSIPDAMWYTMVTVITLG